jgi:hypothetical protein
LGRRDSCRIDLGTWPPVAPLRPDYIRPICGPETFTCFHFHSELGFHRLVVPRESKSTTKLRSAAAAPVHANQVEDQERPGGRWMTAPQ